jgi:hypothetical protein
MGLEGSFFLLCFMKVMLYKSSDGNGIHVPSYSSCCSHTRAPREDTTHIKLLFEASKAVHWEWCHPL